LCQTNIILPDDPDIEYSNSWRKPSKKAKASFEANLHNFAFRNDSKIFQNVRNITKPASMHSIWCFLMKNLPPKILKRQLYSIYTFTVLLLKVPMHFHNSFSYLYGWFHQYHRRWSIHYAYCLLIQPRWLYSVDGISPSVLKICVFVLTKLLCYLFSLLIFYCCLPSEWKHIVSSLSLKRLIKNLNIVLNYHPLSLLCIACKVFEHVIHSKVISFISDRISTLQFGFMEGRSTL